MSIVLPAGDETRGRLLSLLDSPILQKLADLWEESLAPLGWSALLNPLMYTRLYRAWRTRRLRERLVGQFLRSILDPDLGFTMQPVRVQQIIEDACDERGLPRPKREEILAYYKTLSALFFGNAAFRAHLRDAGAFEFFQLKLSLVEKRASNFELYSRPNGSLPDAATHASLDFQDVADQRIRGAAELDEDHTPELPSGGVAPTAAEERDVDDTAEPTGPASPCDLEAEIDEDETGREEGGCDSGDA